MAGLLRPAADGEAEAATTAATDDDADHAADARRNYDAGAGRPPATPAPAQAMTREEALAQSPRIRIETPRLAGSVALKGGRIDDLTLTQYRETVDPNSPPIVLLAPSGSPHPFYGEFGWLPAARRDDQGAGREHAVDAAGRGPAHRRPSGHARLGQRRRARIPPHHRGRRQVHVHRQGRGRRTRARRRSRFIPMR